MSNNFDWKSYDFIEEGLGYNPEPLSFSEVNDEVILESKGSASSKHKIIGKISGCFQEVGGFSRNKRYYTPEHWRIQLEKLDLQERLKNGDILGTIGHFDRPVSDEDIREGRVSHIVRVLEIREDLTGKPFLYGEMDIIDTKAGRNLKGLYEGGANLYVSSRAAGKLLDTPGKDYKTVDPMNFHFECFDTVRRPGFLAAKPVYEDVSSISTPAAPVVSEAIVVEEPTHIDSKDVSVQNEEINALKAQVSKLAKIMEKVVDDVYEVKEEPTNEAQAGLVGALALLAETNISEEAMMEVLEAIKKGLK